MRDEPHLGVGVTCPIECASRTSEAIRSSAGHPVNVGIRSTSTATGVDTHVGDQSEIDDRDARVLRVVDRPEDVDHRVAP